MSKAKLPEVVETSGSFYSVYVRWLIPFWLLLPVVSVQLSEKNKEWLYKKCGNMVKWMHKKCGNMVK